MSSFLIDDSSPVTQPPPTLSHLLPTHPLNVLLFFACQILMFVVAVYFLVA